jgi:Phytanoyl-CoA dioxygenase (PhyH)
MARAGILDANNRIKSEVWVDQPNALEHLANLQNQGLVSETEAIRLSKLVRDGYTVFPSGLSDEEIKAARDLARKLWKERPHDLLAADNGLNRGRPFPMSLFPGDFRERPGCRILDAHSHSQHFLQLTALPILHRMINLILGEQCIATQSLYFSHGSGQSLHRDPWFVITTPIATLYAAWIALEDITPDSGPLLYVPGSHVLPYKPLNTGDIIFHDPLAEESSKAEHRADLRQRMADGGLKPMPFLAKAGEILIWHGSLVHGGSEIQNQNATRASYVIHFDAKRLHPRRGTTITYGENKPKVFYQNSPTELNGTSYFSNPIAGKPLNEIVEFTNPKTSDVA